MTCDFTSFLTVFQSYQDNGWMIIKGCVQWNSFTAEKVSSRVRIELGPLDHLLPRKCEAKAPQVFRQPKILAYLIL